MDRYTGDGLTSTQRAEEREAEEDRDSGMTAALEWLAAHRTWYSTPGSRYYEALCVCGDVLARNEWREHVEGCAELRAECAK